MAWKPPIERRVLEAKGMRGAVIVSGVAYGDGGGGLPALLLGSPRDDAGNLIMVGTGRQHWATVHAADLADSSGASWKTTRPAAATSSATDCTRPWPS